MSKATEQPSSANTVKRKGEAVALQTPDFLAEQAEQIRQILPHVFTEGKIDLQKLRTALGDSVDERPERYSFTWAGKRAAIQELQKPTWATLIPEKSESINFDTTQNIFIEGENLEVLKLLYKSYFGRVKMIYIDPPYNTGGDFVYPDNFTDPKDVYLKITGQKDDNGNLRTSNPESNGRYHSAWLSMIYPRLFLARQFLRDDGVIFVSIDDHEAYNLRLMMNEIFGEENFVTQLVWEKGRKNDAKLFSVGHEYIIVFAKSKAFLGQQNTFWREAKPGAAEIQTEYLRLKQKHGNKIAVIQQDLREFYAKLPKTHPAKKHSRYGNVDEVGVWRDDNMSWPGGGGPNYDVIHPKTKKPCQVPEGGWRYSKPEKMQEMINAGRVVFREDHTEPPIRKTYLVRQNGETEEDDDTDTGIQVAGSYFYRSALQASNLMLNLFGEKVFDNPKDHEILARFIKYVGTEKNDIVLDFFSGSATTAQAVLELNRQDGGNRKFLLVQLPERTGREDFKSIADIGKERIRRVIAQMLKIKEGELPLTNLNSQENLGFAVFKLNPSNFMPWVNEPSPTPETLATAMELFNDPLVGGWKPENVIYEVATKEGFSLTSRVEKLPAFKANKIFEVKDTEKGQSFRICLDDELKAATVKELNLKKDDLFICRDVAIDDKLAANLALQCRLKTI